MSLYLRHGENGSRKPGHLGRLSSATIKVCVPFIAPRCPRRRPVSSALGLTAAALRSPLEGAFCVGPKER